MEWHARSIKSRLGTVVRERNPLALVVTVSVKEVKEIPLVREGDFFGLGKIVEKTEKRTRLWSSVRTQCFRQRG